MTTIVMEVRGMHCGGCESAVREAVGALPGVSRVVAEHIGDEVEVDYDPELVGPDELRRAIVDAGFAA